MSLRSEKSTQPKLFAYFLSCNCFAKDFRYQELYKSITEIDYLVTHQFKESELAMKHNIAKVIVNYLKKYSVVLFGNVFDD